MARTGVRVSAIIIRKGKVLLIRRRKPGKEYWVFPSGGVEDGETQEETLIREVKEETNLNVLNYKEAFVAPYSLLGNTKHPFYHCEVGEGEPEIIGEEKDINSDSDQYHLEWVELNRLASYNLIPPEAKTEMTKLASTLSGVK